LRGLHVRRRVEEHDRAAFGKHLDDRPDEKEFNFAQVIKRVKDDPLESLKPLVVLRSRSRKSAAVVSIG